MHTARWALIVLRVLAFLTGSMTLLAARENLNVG